MRHLERIKNSERIKIKMCGLLFYAGQKNKTKTFEKGSNVYMHVYGSFSFVKVPIFLRVSRILRRKIAAETHRNPLRKP